MKQFYIPLQCCDTGFVLSAFSVKDALRRLGAMTNCPVGSHVTLPSLLQFVDVRGVEEKKEEKEFQELDTSTRQ